MENLLIICDGGSHQNGGECGIGVVVKDRISGQRIYAEKKSIGKGSNNFSEYMAVILALNYILDSTDIKEIKSVQIVSDSNLVVNQINGKFEVRTPSLIPHYSEADRLFRKIQEWGIEISIDHVPTEYTFEAHNLAQEAIKAAIDLSINEKFPLLRKGTKN